MTLLRVGSRGTAVKKLQAKLGAVQDGVFGPKTRAALIIWQTTHHLYGDGVYGPKTAAKMYPVRTAVKTVAAKAALKASGSKLTVRGVAYLKYLNAAADNPEHKDEYYWGATGADVDHDGSPDWDCSGIRHGALVSAGIPDVRTTAEGYRKRAVKIAAPSQLGDFAVLLRPDGTAHHIIQYATGTGTIEAKGKAYGVVRDTVSGVNARGGVWYRQSSVNAVLSAR